MQSSEHFRQLLQLNNEQFEAMALEVAKYQFQHNILYHNYCNSLKIAWDKVDSLAKIPFLPISFFKNHEVKTGEFQEECIFTSSATTGTSTSKHFVKHISEYDLVFTSIFNQFYGNPSDFIILGLLPSYLERTGSSLIHMVQKLIDLSGNEKSGFFLNEHQFLAETLAQAEKSRKKAILIGVTFALLDFAEKFPMNLQNTIIIETGGMKGRGQEIIREEVNERLRCAFGAETIHSEYGMTELLSQAYSSCLGIFSSPPWMKILIRDTSDPLGTFVTGSGALNIIDLANIHSCAFIASQDLGKVHPNGTFEVTGRMDRSDVRGCNLLVL
jgi:phenylacetate-coenzyme A ligase PaaK-like adenylate-forming protein